VKARLISAFQLLFSIFCFGVGYAQVFDDWEARPGISVEHEFGNGIEIEGKFRHYLFDDSNSYNRTRLGVKVDYDYTLAPWLEPGIDYRYKYNGGRGSHSIRYSVKTYQNLGNNIEMEYSLRLQQRLESDQNPEYTLRNKVELSYPLIGPLSIFVFAENYQMIKAGFGFDAQKSGLGTEFEFDNANELGLKFDVKNKSDHQDIGRFSINYTYTIP